MQALPYFRQPLRSLGSLFSRVTGRLADATGDFERLVFVLLAASARPRVVWSPRIGNPRVGVSASCPCAATAAVAENLAAAVVNNVSLIVIC